MNVSKKRISESNDMADQKNPPPASSQESLPFWKKNWFLLILILGIGGAGGYFRYYFHQYHLQLKGFTYLGIQEYGHQYLYRYRHKATGLTFVLVPGKRGDGKKGNQILPFLISQDLIDGQTMEKIQGDSPKKDFPRNLDNTSISWDGANHFCQSFGLELPSQKLLEYAFQFQIQKGLGLKDFGKYFEWTKDKLYAKNGELGKIKKIALKARFFKERGWRIQKKGFHFIPHPEKVVFRCIFLPNSIK